MSPEYCFIVEDEAGICGYALAALDSQQFHNKLDLAWFPEVCNKYPAPKEKISNGEMLTPLEEVINNVHNNGLSNNIPDLVYKNHPSILQMSVMPHIMDLSVPKRMLACVLAALKANG